MRWLRALAFAALLVACVADGATDGSTGAVGPTSSPDSIAPAPTVAAGGAFAAAPPAALASAPEPTPTAAANVQANIDATIGWGFSILTGRKTKPLFNLNVSPPERRELQSNSLETAATTFTRFAEYFAARSAQNGLSTASADFQGAFSLDPDMEEMKRVLKDNTLSQVVREFRLYEMVLHPQLDSLCGGGSGNASSCCFIARKDIFSSEFVRAVGRLPSADVGPQDTDAVYAWSAPTPAHLLVRRFLSEFGTHYIHRAVFGGEVRMSTIRPRTAAADDDGKKRDDSELGLLMNEELKANQRHEAGRISRIQSAGRDQQITTIDGDAMLEKMLHFVSTLPSDGAPAATAAQLSPATTLVAAADPLQAVEKSVLAAELSSALPRASRAAESQAAAREQLAEFERSGRFKMVFRGGDPSLAQDTTRFNAFVEWQQSVLAAPVVLQIELRPVAELVASYLNPCDDDGSASEGPAGVEPGSLTRPPATPPPKPKFTQIRQDEVQAQASEKAEEAAAEQQQHQQQHASGGVHPRLLGRRHHRRRHVRAGKGETLQPAASAAAMVPARTTTEPIVMLEVAAGPVCFGVSNTQCPADYPDWSARKANVAQSVQQVLRIGATLRAQREILIAYRTDYERPGDLLSKRDRCDKYQTAVDTYRKYWSWLTGADVSSADLEPIYCADLESDEQISREAAATLAADASPVCAFCTTIYNAVKRLYSFKADTFVNTNDDPMFPTWRQFVALLDSNGCTLTNRTIPDDLQNAGSRAYRKFPEFLTGFVLPEYLCKDAACESLLTDFFRTPMCFYDKSNYLRGNYPSWETNELAAFRRRFFQSFEYGCRANGVNFKGARGDCPALYACSYAGVCSAKDFAFPLSTPVQAISLFPPAMLTVREGRTWSVGMPVTVGAGLYVNVPTKCGPQPPTLAAGKPFPWNPSGGSVDNGTSAAPPQKVDTLHIIDDLALVTRAAFFPSPTIATTLKYAPDGWHRAYAWGFSIAVEELQDQVVCHTWQFDNLNRAQYVLWREFFCKSFVADTVAEEACAFADGSGDWFVGTDLKQPPTQNQITTKRKKAPRDE